MKIAEMGDFYRQQLELVRGLETEGLWRREAADLLARAEQDIPDTDDLLQVLHELQRLGTVASGGLAGNAAFKEAVAKEKAPLWKDFGAPPVSLDLQHSLAEKLYNADRQPGCFAMINVGDGAREIGKWLTEKCIARNVPFLVNFADPVFSNLALIHADEKGVDALAAAYLEKTAPVKTVMTARPGLPETALPKVDKEKAQAYSRKTALFGERIGKGDIYYTLTAIPTRQDAKVDGIDYDDYIRLFFEMCDQPWEQIGKAQAELIREFNVASKVRITNDDGTDLSMELVDHDGAHFTFCNSLIAKNVPGSEIFSAPRLDSVNGKIVAQGRFSEHGSAIIENLTMEFEKGKLVRYSAEKGVEAFEKAIGVDEGAQFVGELGIGTNPHLRQHVTNGLLVEKIGGSFHVALGRAYSYTSYEGVPVKVDNGNKSALHWDVTTMLRGKGGKIYLDGRLIMDDGQWLDAKYDVLNRGWESLPKDKRPDYWKSYYDKKPGP